MLKIALKTLAIFLVVFLLIIASLNIPAVQTFITGKITTYLKNQLGTELGIGAVKISFPKTIHLEDIFFADQNADTLLYVNTIDINISMLKLLKQEVLVSNLEIQTLKARVFRGPPGTDFNFDFIINAFAADDTLSEPPTVTSSKPWKISADNILFSSLDVRYRDETLGMDAHLDLGELEININELDFTNFGFFVEDIQLENTFVELVQWTVENQNLLTESAGLQNSPPSPASIPSVGLNLFTLRNVNLSYRDSTSKMNMEFNVGDLKLEPEVSDLKNQKISLKKLDLANSQVLISLLSDTTSIPEKDSLLLKKTKETLAAYSVMSGWDLSLERLNIHNLGLKLENRNLPKTENGLDFNHLFFDDITLESQNISLTDQYTGIDILNLSMKDHSGFVLKNLKLQAGISEKNASIQEMLIQTDKSKIKGSIRADFELFDDLFNNPGNVGVVLDLNPSKIYTNDIFFAAGLNPADSLYKNYANLSVDINARIQGKIDSLNFDKLGVALFDQTRISVKGTASSITNPDSLGFNISVDTLFTNKTDLLKMIDTSLLAGINIPDSMFIALTASGTPDSVHTAFSFLSDFGKLSGKAFYKSDTESMRDTFHVYLQPESFHVGKLLADSTFGETDARTTIAGTGLSSDSISARLEGTLVKAFYNGYNYSNIDFEAAADGMYFRTHISSNDPNAKLDFEATARLDSVNLTLVSNLDIDLLNLYDLNFLKEKVGIKTNLSLKGSYASLNELEAELLISNTDIIWDNSSFPIKQVGIHPLFTPENTRLRVESDLLNIDFDSNIALDEFEGVMIPAARKYLGLRDSVMLPPDKNFDFLVSINLPREFRSYFLPDLKELALDSIIGKYQSNNNALDLTVHAPKINYENMELQNLSMSLHGKSDSLLLSAGFEKLYFDTVFINAFTIQETISNGDINSIISLNDQNGKKAYYFENEILVSDTGIRIHFSKNGLIMDGKPWQILPGNYLEITDSAIFSNDFIFREGQQEISFEVNDTCQLLRTENFELANLQNILNFNNGVTLFEGRLKSDISIPLHNNYEGISAKLSIQNLHFYDSLIGDIDFRLTETISHLQMQFSLQNDKNNLSAKGEIAKSDYPQPIDINVNLDISAPERLEVFSMGEISNSSGIVTGDLKIGGYLDRPSIEGFVHFTNTQLKINRLNLLAKLNKEKISFNSEGVIFDDFSIYDAQDHEMVISGKLLTRDYSAFTFDLKLNTKNFQPINSTKKDNPIFYGNLIIDADLMVKGSADLPIVDADISIGKGTDLTYTMPGSEIEMVSSEGIVNFVNPTQGSDTIFKKTASNYISDSIISKFIGIDLNARLELDPEAKFTVIIDPYSGDYTSVSGKAQLNISMDPSGGQSLTGAFEVTDGIYQLSFYGLIKKTFVFEPGSSIAWSGRLMDANMNFTAKHVVRTQSIALVSNESAEMSDAEKNVFKQRLPYEVLLNIDGFLSEPEVSFTIDLPEKYLVNYPQISSKLTMLNSSQNESELNKQVFALLVTGSFIADNPFASTGGSAQNFATTAARNSVNGILAEQLNKISNRFIKGVDMNFGLTSYEETSGSNSQMRTELDVRVSKKLLKDRLTIEASGSFDVEGNRQYTSTNTSHTNGEFSATYDLDENKEFKLRAYRENAYDLFDGEVSYSGLAFIIEKSFNSLLKRKAKTPESNEKDK